MAEEPSQCRGVHAAALASLPQAGSRRLQRLMGGRDPGEVWAGVKRGLIPVDCGPEDLRRAWREYAAGLDLAELGARIRDLEIWVTTPGSLRHPSRIGNDIDPAPVLFQQGRVLECGNPAVAIVGTRRCSPTGREVAVELGSGLASAGVSVVSGLALGIDGAAHRGALAVDGASPIAVVGSGLDVIYPRRHSELWDKVKTRGTLLSEAPLGAAPEPWRFPARNRLLAALADVTVVVESKVAGGSMHTVEQSMRRGITVMAVPGSVRNPAAAGSNLLLSEGCPPVCSSEDVLMALGLATAGLAGGPRSSRSPRRSSSGEPADLCADDPSERSPPEPRLPALQQRILDAVDDSPVTLDRIMVRVGASPVDTLVAVEELLGHRRLATDGGWLIRGPSQ